MRYCERVNMKKVRVKCKFCGDVHIEVEYTGIIKASWKCERCRKENNSVLIAKNINKIETENKKC